MKYVIPFLTVLFLCQTAISQDYKFGKVSKEELEEKYNPLDSSASATYLYKYRKSFFEYYKEEGFQLVTEVHERIKIYNQEGFDYATRNINLYKSGSDGEKLSSLKAYTYNLVNGKVEEIKLKKDGIFKEEKSKYLNQTKFTMPNIKEGSVIEYKHRTISPFFSNVDEFVFQHDIPVKKIEARFEEPEYFNFKMNPKGYLSVIPKTDSRTDKTTIPGLEFRIKITKFNLNNVPALKDEPYVNNINNYRSSIKFELSYTKFPQTPLKYYSTTWEDVVKSIYKSSSFSTELNKKGYYEDDINVLVSDISDPIKKAFSIFNFVKSNVKWNGYYGKYTSKGVRKAYKEHTGNTADINIMLTSMLRHAGLNANPVLISTRGNGVPLFPTRDGYNYVISCVETPQGTILLDASSKYSAPNILPFRTLNWEGRIIRKDGSFTTVDLYPKKKSSALITMMINLDENGTLEGNVRTMNKDHKAMAYRTSYLEKDEDVFLEDLENKYNGLEISDFEVKNTDDLSKPVMESYKFVKENQADIIGDKIYFSPMFFYRTSENPFKLEKREFPVDFGYPSKSMYRINISLPEGYKIESLPESKVVVLPDNIGKFAYNISGSGLKVNVVISTEIDVPIVPALYYDYLKEYFKQMIEKQNEQVVLTKV